MSELILGSDKFNVDPLDAWSTFELQAKIAPPVAEVMGVLGTELGSGNVADLDVSALGPAVGKFFGHFAQPGSLRALVRELLANATMNGSPLVTTAGDPFAVLMRGRTVDTWKLLWFAVQVNYPDFFGLLGASRGGPSSKPSPSVTSAT